MYTNLYDFEKSTRLSLGFLFHAFFCVFYYFFPQFRYPFNFISFIYSNLFFFFFLFHFGYMYKNIFPRG